MRLRESTGNGLFRAGNQQSRVWFGVKTALQVQCPGCWNWGGESTVGVRNMELNEGFSFVLLCTTQIIVERQFILFICASVIQ